MTKTYVVSRARQGFKTVHVKFTDTWDAQETVAKDMVLGGTHSGDADYYTRFMFVQAGYQQGRAALKVHDATYAVTIDIRP